MPYRIIKTATNNYYHIYNRGNNYQDIFFELKNYLFFLQKLKFYFNNRINLICYCLMPNHYHLLIKITNDTDISFIMQRFSTSYTKAINKAYHRVGHLFQGRYKIKHIPNNDYLLHLSRYIHLNPVRAKLVVIPEDWKFSSFADFIKKESKICSNMDIILDQVSSYEGFVKEYQKNQNYFVRKLLF